jgi:hypothetical protein
MFSMGIHPFWAASGETKKSYVDKMKNLQWTFWPENIDKYIVSIMKVSMQLHHENSCTAF